ncbi:MAG: BrnT family toxin [Acidimicrobiales bacterium]
MELPSPVWDEHNQTDVARHAVTPNEVEEVVNDPDTLATIDDTHRAGRLNVFGKTAAGRHLLIVLDHTTTSSAYVVTARPMTSSERRAYEEAST